MDRDRARRAGPALWLGGAVLALAAAGPARADGVYLGLAVGPQFYNDAEAGNADVELDTGVGFTGAVGYRLGNLRFEGEFGYGTTEGTNDIGVNADIDLVRLTVGGYYDLLPGAPLRPYLGGGIGIANLDSSGDFSDDDSGFTAHGEAGFSYAVTDRLHLVPAYRYEWTDTDIGNIDDDLSAHVVRIGLRYEFPAPGRSAYAGAPAYRPGPAYRYDPFYNPYYDRRRYYDRDRDRPPSKPDPRDRCGFATGPGCPPDSDGFDR